MSNIVVTGGCGFIGRNLVQALLQRGDRVRVMDNLSVGTRNELAEIASVDTSPAWPADSSSVNLVEGDIRNADMCQQAMEGADAAVHLAAQCGVIPSIEDPVFDCETNVLGTMNVLKACVDNKAKHFVFASSSAPLGETIPPIHEKMVPRPLSPYGAAKLAGEGYCSAFCASYDLNSIALRFSNVYGPGSRHKGSVVALFFKRAMEGKPLIVYGSGYQTRDFIYIDDLRNAILCGLDANVGGEVFQIATFKENTVNYIAEQIKTLVERDTDRSVEITYEGERKGEVTRSFSDISKAQEMLGYEPLMDLEQGLGITWNWFRELYASEYQL